MAFGPLYLTLSHQHLIDGSTNTQEYKNTNFLIMTIDMIDELSCSIVYGMIIVNGTFDHLYHEPDLLSSLSENIQGISRGHFCFHL